MSTTADLRHHLPVVQPPRVRKRTVSLNRLSKRELSRDAAQSPPSINEAHPRPRTYGECDAYDFGDGDGPVRLGVDLGCPFVSCAHHLALDVTENGNLTINFPDREPDELDATCALRVADARHVGHSHDGDATLDEIAAVMNLTRERVRQVEVRALAALRDVAWHDPGVLSHAEDLLTSARPGVVRALPDGDAVDEELLADLTVTHAYGGSW